LTFREICIRIFSLFYDHKVKRMEPVLCPSENDANTEYYVRLREIIAEAERRAINKYKYVLSQQRGCEVGFPEAMQDWSKNCAKQWHADRMKRMLHSQREEINRFKWIVSEGAGRDLGRSAVEEWIHKHAPGWRFNWEETHIDADESIGG